MAVGAVETAGRDGSPENVRDDAAARRAHRDRTYNRQGTTILEKVL